jgi:hypothetical protein
LFVGGSGLQWISEAGTAPQLDLHEDELLGPNIVDTEKQPDEARNGACVAIRDQDIAG